MTYRGYRGGDETIIVDFLNRCFSEKVSNLEKWRWQNIDYPTFKKENVFILEANGEMVGHRALVMREFQVAKDRLATATLGSTAVHPGFRGFGIYSHLHELTMQASISQGASLIFTWNAKGGITYNHNLKNRFVPIAQPVYIKIVNHRKLLQTQIGNIVTANRKIGSLLQQFKHQVSISLVKDEVTFAELLGEHGDDSADISIRIMFTERAVPLLLGLRTGGKIRRMVNLLNLVLTGKMKVKVKSIPVFLRFIRQGVKAVI